MNNEMFFDSTVKITTFYPNGYCATGTGFFYLIKKGDKFVPTIVTNKHVIKNAVRGTFRLSLSDSIKREKRNGEYIDIAIENFESQWTMHPDNDVDLCIMPIGSLISQSERNGKIIYFKAIDNSLIPNEETINGLTAIEEVLMVGYPIGLWDSYNNTPIVRKGITATNIKLDYNGKKEFLIDIAAFPGSSGSPVFIYNQGAYPDKNGLIIGDRVLFVGILYGGIEMNLHGEIHMIEAPTANMPVVNSNLPINTGVIIKAEKLFQLETVLIEKLLKGK